jgi:hypothetical protein
MVYHTGEVLFPVLMKLRTTCKVNIQYFPFDRQICGLKFASWIYDVSSINYELVVNGSDQPQSENIRNSGWTILDVKQGLVWRYVIFIFVSLPDDLIITKEKNCFLVNDYLIRLSSESENIERIWILI